MLSHQPQLAVASIPIDDRRWDRFFGRLQQDVKSLLDVRSQVEAAAGSGDFVALRSAAQAVAGTLVQLERRTQAAAAFIHPKGPALRELSTAVRALTAVWHERLTSDEGDMNTPRPLDAAAIAEISEALVRVR